jgi:membrane associated rhomboid family serine protease
MIGASAAVSGFMAGAMRFAFQPGGPIATFRTADPDSYRVPALRLAVALRDVRVLVFVVAWSAANLMFGISGIGLQGEEQSVAWQAHFGGFVVGLLLFSWFDPVPTKST